MELDHGTIHGSFTQERCFCFQLYLQRESLWDKSIARDITPKWMYPTVPGTQSTYEVFLGAPQADGVPLEFVGASIAIS